MAEKVIPFDPEGGLIEQLLNLPIKRNGIYPLRYDEQRRGLVKAREVEGEREYPYDTVAIVKGKDGILATEPWAVRAKRYHDCPFVSIECCDNGTKRVHFETRASNFRAFFAEGNDGKIVSQSRLRIPVLDGLTSLYPEYVGNDWKTMRFNQMESYTESQIRLVLKEGLPEDIDVNKAMMSVVVRPQFRYDNYIVAPELTFCRGMFDYYSVIQNGDNYVHAVKRIYETSKCKRGTLIEAVALTDADRLKLPCRLRVRIQDFAEIPYVYHGGQEGKATRVTGIVSFNNGERTSVYQGAFIVHNDLCGTRKSPASIAGAAFKEFFWASQEVKLSDGSKDRR